MAGEERDIYIGLSGVSLPEDMVDLGHGIKLSRTYAHIFSHPMLAIKPPERAGSHHPGPWIALRHFFGNAPAGEYETVETELYIPTSAAGSMDAWDLAGWITFLIRLRSDSWPEMRLSSDKPFSKGGNENSVSLYGTVRMQQRERPNLRATLDWVRRNWHAAAHLAGDKNFRFAAEAIFNNQPRHSVEMSLLITWAALERLFSHSNAELAFRVSAYIACFLEPRGATRLSLQREIVGLYGDRSTVAHGSDLKNPNAFKRTNEIAHAVLVRIVEQRRVPTKEELNSLLLA